MLFPYAIRLEQDGQHPMADAISRVWTSNPKASRLGPIRPPAVWLLGKLDGPPLHRAIPLIVPQINWKAGQDVVDLLLQIASVHSLLPHIPIEIWAWLKERPSLPPVSRGRCLGTARAIICRIRDLGDIEILKSYFLVVWSEWDFLYPDGIEEMEISIREDFGGIEMKWHRKDLIVRLDCVLEQLEDTRHDEVQYKKEQYGGLKEVLLEVDGEQ